MVILIKNRGDGYQYRIELLIADDKTLNRSKALDKLRPSIDSENLAHKKKINIFIFLFNK